LSGAAVVFALPLRSAPAGPVPGPVAALAFSPDGRSLLIGSYSEVVVRTVADGKIACRLPCGLSQIHDITFSPNGKILAVAGGKPGASGAVCLLDWQTGKPLSTLAGHTDTVTSIGFSPDGNLLATGSADKTILVHRLKGAGGTEPLHKLKEHTGPVLSVAFSPDGAVLVTGSADRSLRVWDTKTGKHLQTLTNHTGSVYCVAFRTRQGSATTESQAVCASGSEDRTVRVWMPGIGRMVRIVRNHEGSVLALAYSHDGKRLFSAGTDGVIRVIDAESDVVQQSWRAHASPIYSLAVSPDGRHLASGDWSGAVRLWDAATGARRR
jgi:WD40 repeat protein